MSECCNSVVLRSVGRIVAGYIEDAFTKGSWKYNVDLDVRLKGE